MKTPSADYIAKEEATQRKPAELYRIWHGTTYYYHTNGDVSVTYDGHTYTPASIKRGSVTYDSGLEANTISIQFERTLTPIVEYIASNPVEIVWVEVSRLFRDQSPYETSIIFIGQIKDISMKGLVISVSCVGFEFLLRQTIPILRYQPQCNWTVYGTKCGKSSSGFTISPTNVTVSADGLEVTHVDIGGQADGYWKFGKLVWGDYERLITYHVGNTIKVRYPMTGFATGQNVVVYAGCEGSIGDACYTRFNNVDNFGGHPYIPLDNPTLWQD